MATETKKSMLRPYRTAISDGSGDDKVIVNFQILKADKKIALARAKKQRLSLSQYIRAAIGAKDISDGSKGGKRPGAGRPKKIEP